MTDLLMPRLTDQMEEGTIVAWLVEDGARVTAGEEVVEIETDKATISHAAESDGALHIVAAVGDTVSVGAVIARLGDGAAVPVGVTADAPAIVAANGDVAQVAPVRRDGVASTPLARRAAAVHDVDLAVVEGSGPGGRIIKADVLAAAGVRPPDPPTPTPRAPTPAPLAPADGRRVAPTRLQQVVARRMFEATTTIPHFQVQTEVQVDAALALRAELKANSADGQPVPSVNDLVVKACALVLPDHPLVNGSFTEGGFVLHDDVHVGVAVAVDDGLLVVTVRDADSKSLGHIARDTRELARRAREGDATPGELTGATFTVSNLGMFGMTAITAVINPPQAAILGVGAARATLARAQDGGIVDRRLLTLTLSGDHRILNGADGARFLADVRATLESPLRLAF